MSLDAIPSPLSRRARYLCASVLVLGVAGGLVAFLSTRPAAVPVAPAAQSSPPSVVQVTEGDFHYSFHVVTGAEGLFDLSADPKALRNLADSKPELVLKLRQRLLREMRIQSFEELRAESQDTIDRLKALGYL